VTVDLVLRDVRHVLMLDESGGRAEGVSIAIHEGLIVGIGDDIEANRTIDGRDLLVMPGLINLHTHLAMSLLRGIAEDVDLQGFLERVWAEEARLMNVHGVEVGTRLGALEALLSGTTTTLDMYFHPEAAHRAAVEVGLRHVIGPVFFSSDGPDGLAWDQRMALARAWPGRLAAMGGPRVPPALMPHAAFTVGVDHLAEIAQLADQQGAVVHVHASENDRENEDTISLAGMRPIEALDKAGILDLRTVLGHGVRLNDTERSRIAATGTAVAHCPGSNLKLSSGAADLVGYRSDGIRVGLGTDGCASSNDLDMFSVMRLAANLARLVRSDPAAISSGDIVAAATLEGARALGLDAHLGTVEIGKEADLIAIDLNAPHFVPLHDPYTAVVYAAGRSDVRHTLVAGELVVEDRRPTRVSAGQIMDEARDLVEVP
jgi:5-methylthioadenosine/S-adenosylhomocysteine deaminase